MARNLSTCPVCDGALTISELACAACGVSVRGKFDRCKFCALSADHLSFVEAFLRCEGNISRVERELNISYPTVRNRLAAALQALSLGEAQDTAPVPPPTPPRPPALTRSEVLERLSLGTISADEAAELLRDA